MAAGVGTPQMFGAPGACECRQRAPSTSSFISCSAVPTILAVNSLLPVNGNNSLLQVNGNVSFETFKRILLKHLHDDHGHQVQLPILLPPPPCYLRPLFCNPCILVPPSTLSYPLPSTATAATSQMFIAERDGCNGLRAR